MDVGAPLLDVSANVVNNADPNSKNQTNSPVSIISGGAVVADNYDPIVITDVEALNHSSLYGEDIDDGEIETNENTSIASNSTDENDD